MKIVKPSYEILTPISKGGIQELKHIEKIARVCYKSEDRITEDGESAKKFIKSIIARGHESTLEHISISVKFTVDRGVTHEMVRHRIASYSQESSRYCNYSLGKFGDEITVVLPTNYFWVVGIGNRIFGNEYELKYDHITRKEFDDIFASNQLSKGNPSNFELQQYYWAKGCLDAEANYMNMIAHGAKPEEARAVLPNSTKADITMTCNVREFRTIFKLRCSEFAHPDIRYIMRRLLDELHSKIPVLFDDLYEKYLTGNDGSC